MYDWYSLIQSSISEKQSKIWLGKAKCDYGENWELVKASLKYRYSKTKTKKKVWIQIVNLIFFSILKD